jgi:tRNA A37 threonylcarbamoyladenosine synthetase subunit TsaC/SUA5/YrdC
MAYRNTTYEIFQRAVDYKQLDIDQRMIILVAALEPLKEIIFPDHNWDKRGKKHIEVFI